MLAGRPRSLPAQNRVALLDDDLSTSPGDVGRALFGSDGSAPRRTKGGRRGTNEVLARLAGHLDSLDGGDGVEEVRSSLFEALLSVRSRIRRRWSVIDQRAESGKRWKGCRGERERQRMLQCGRRRTTDTFDRTAALGDSAVRSRDPLHGGSQGQDVVATLIRRDAERVSPL